MFGKPELPDELKSLNLTPAQILEAVNAKTELETRLNAELTSLKTTITEGQNQFNDLKTKFDLLEANPPSRENPPLREKTSFLTDEDKAFNERFMEQVGPVAMAAAISSSKSAKLIARASLEGQFITDGSGRNISLIRLWDKWFSEIDDAAKKVPIAHLGAEETWLNLFDFVKGKHVSELFSKPDNFIEPVSTSINSRLGEKPLQEKLNDEEASIAKKMSRYGKGTTPEKILEMREKINFVNV